jgi:hypothetical protein
VVLAPPGLTLAWRVADVLLTLPACSPETFGLCVFALAWVTVNVVCPRLPECVLSPEYVAVIVGEPEPTFDGV